MSTRVHIVMDDELLARVDDLRGDVPRSAWMRRAVGEAVDAHWGPNARAVVPEPRKVKVDPPVTQQKVAEAVNRGAFVGGAEAKPKIAGAEAAPPRMKRASELERPKRRPVCRCSVCGLESSDPKWGCPEHGYGKVRPV